MNSRLTRTAAVASLLTLAFGGLGGTAQASTPVNSSLSFTVPAIGVPKVVCIAINGEKTCNPVAGTNVIVATIEAALSEGTGFTVAEGAPVNTGSGENCAALAKTVSLTLAADASASLSVTGTPEPIYHLIGAGEEAPSQTNTVEVCVAG